MTARYTVITRSGHRYTGSLRDGSFEVDGLAFPAANVDDMKIWIHADGSGSYLPGSAKLIDGSTLNIRQWTTGLFSREYHIDLSGELVIFVDSLGKDVRVDAGDIEHFYRVH